MRNGLLLKLIHIWWAGVKVFFRWSAFWIILSILCLPAIVLINLVGDYAGYVLGMIFLILVVPLLFYLTSKYLLLLGDSENNPTDCTDHTGNAQESSAARIATRRVTAVVVPFVFLIVAAILSPPDVISQLFLTAQMLLVAGILAFIVSRFKSFAQAPENIRRLIIVLVCLLSILIPFTIMITNILRHKDRSASSLILPSMPPSTSYSSFSMGNLWIDKRHAVTHLRAGLREEDVSLLRNHRNDEELKISSPDELLALIKRLKAEQAAAAAPLEAAN